MTPEQQLELAQLEATTKQVNSTRSLVNDGVIRIGDRNPKSGDRAVIYQTGDSTDNGRYISNSSYIPGEAVAALNMDDGTIALDRKPANKSGQSATDLASIQASTSDSNLLYPTGTDDGTGAGGSIAKQLSKGAFHYVGNYEGYLNGQLFNGKRKNKPTTGLFWQKEGSTQKTGSVYQLTQATAPTDQAGGLVSVQPISTSNWILKFEFRIYGSSTISTAYADGIAVAYTSLPLGSSGQREGVPFPLNNYEAAILLDTYRNDPDPTKHGDNANRPRLMALTAGQDENTMGIPLSAVDGRLRSINWQQAEISYDGNNLVGYFGSQSVNIAIVMPVGKRLRISAGTGNYDDKHEIRNIFFNGQSVSVI